MIPMSNLTPITGGEGQPPEPDWTQIYSDPMDVAACSEAWQHSLSEMRDANTLSMACGPILKSYVVMQIEADKSLRHVAENGKVLKAKRTGTPAWNLEWLAFRQAAGDVKDFAKALGLSPDGRTKVGKVQNAKKAPRAADRFLAPKRA